MEAVNSNLRSSLSLRELSRYCCGQLNQFYPDCNEVSPAFLSTYIDSALERYEYCFSHVKNKYVFDGKNVYFNHLNGDQYATFLYFLANNIFNDMGSALVCNKLFLLNKQMHGLDLFYEVELPDIFLLVHPVGTVLGRAEYSDYFVAYQRCGVGSNNQQSPSFGRHFTMRPGSSALGGVKTGDYCQLSSVTLVIDEQLEGNSTIFGGPSNRKCRPLTKDLDFWR